MSSPDRLRVLVVAPFAPRIAATDGGSRVMGELVTRLAERYELAILHLREAGNPGVDDAVRAACTFVEEHPVPVRGRLGRGTVALTGLAVGRPRWASHLSAPGFARRLQTLVDQWRPDLVQVEFGVIGGCLPTLRKPRPPVVLVEHDPGMVTAAEQHGTHPGRGWRRAVSRADVAAWRRHERRVLGAVDAVVVFTEEDRETVALAAPRGLPVETIPFGISPLPEAGAVAERDDTVLFVGSFVHPPNVDAAMRLVQGIQPLLLALRPEARLVIVGERPPAELRAAAGPSVEIAGRVPSVEPYLAEAAVVAVPVRLGGGMRVKMHEAFAAGKAVVSSARALAGMEVRDGVHVVVAESDEEFAARTAELLADPARRHAIGRAAGAWAAEHLGWDATLDRYASLYARLGRRARQPEEVGAAATGVTAAWSGEAADLRAPLVSICIPAYNAERWIGEAVSSALAQTLEDTEVVVVDNASTDDTVELVRSFDDPRLRVVVNATNVGPVRNFNRCVALARGRYVKYLHADDVLYPACCASMAELLDASPNVGLVFAPRDVLLEHPDDPAEQAWRERYGVLHEPFSSLERVNDGRRLFREWLDVGVHENLVGEPTAVLVRRDCFERLGGFNPDLWQLVDVEMWLRILLHYDAGFVPEPLCAYRHHESSSTAGVARSSVDWLDDLWVLERLLCERLTADERHAVLAQRRTQMRRAFRAQAGRIVRGDRRLDQLAAWGRYRISRPGRRGPSFFQPVPPPPLP